MADSEREFIKPTFPSEDVEEYCEGGFHPIRVGSLFRGRFFIRGKLGYGGCGTVWWANDIVQERHVAIKIMTAAASEKLECFRTFYYHDAGEDVAPHHSGRSHVVTLIRSFWFKGPNGRHLCLEMELAGPKVEDYAKYRPSGALTISEIQKMGLDTAKALAYLHVNGYVHGDLTPSNIFMGITDPRNWNDFQLRVADEMRQSVASELLLRTTGETAQPNGPRLITSKMELWKLDHSCITSNIIVGDLDASFRTGNGPAKNFILPPLHYCAPELLTQEIPRQADMRTDIWTFALTLFVLRSSTLLFPRTKDVNEMFINIWLRLGDSTALSEMWTTKAESVSDDGNLMVHTAIHKTLREMVADIGNHSGSDIEVASGTNSEAVTSALDDVCSSIAVKSIDEPWTPKLTSPAEVEMFNDLLIKMLQIEPQKRIKIDEVLRHPWFTTEFDARIPEPETTIEVHDFATPEN